MEFSTYDTWNLLCVSYLNPVFIKFFENRGKLYEYSLPILHMTSEITGSTPHRFDSDTHDQETKKSYYHNFDDESVEKMIRYFKVNEDQDAFLRYLKNRKIPKTTPDHV